MSGRRIGCLMLSCFIFFTLLLVPNVSKADDPLNILSVSPSEVRNDGGQIITISGMGFMLGMKVYLNDELVEQGDVSVELRVTGHDTAEVMTPGGITGNVKVRAEDPGDSNNYDVLFNAFWYLSTPEITSVEPKQGSTIGGTTVTIDGSEFGQAGGLGDNVQVYLGPTLVEDFTLISSTQLSLVTPPGTVGSKSITVVNADGGSFTVPATSANAFTYAASNPEITSVDPSYGPNTGGTQVTIQGNEFSSSATVRIGDHWAQTIDHVGSTRLDVTVPASEVLGDANVTVQNPDGRADTVSGAFEYVPVPVINNITPNFGVPGEDCTENPVVISGANFNTSPEGVAVYFGGMPATIGSHTSSVINVVGLPLVSPGTVHVKVVNLNDIRQEYTLQNGFTFQAEVSTPTIDAITPNSGSTEENTDVVITGSQLLTGASMFVGSDQVSLEGADFVSTSEVHVTIPPSATAGSKAVTWINYDGGQCVFTDNGGFTHIRPEEQAKIISITPNSGPEDRNTLITIRGINFLDPGDPDFISCEVRIGDIPVQDLTWVDARTLKAETPLGYIKAGETQTSWDVTFTQTYRVGEGELTQTYTLPNGFTYVLPESSPFVAEIYDRELFCSQQMAVDSGPLAGGNEIIIAGADFRTEGGLLPVVEFGSDSTWNAGSVLQVITLDPDQTDPDYELGLPGYIPGQQEMVIVVVAPAGVTTGAVDVRVTNPDGCWDTVTNGWIYKTCTLAVTAVTPDSGSVAGGEEVVISGANFTEDYDLWVEFVHEDERTVVESSHVLEISPSAIRIELPPNTAGMKDVVVSNRFGSAVLTDGFFYKSLSSSPVIDTVSPEDGSVLGGDTVIISGMDFRVGAQVMFGTAAAQVVSASWDELDVIIPPGTVGLQDVTVINPDGGQTVKEDAFTYVSYPQITAISPATVGTDGGTIITITGTQFFEGAQVFFRNGDETEAPDVKVMSATAARARVPSLAAGSYDVILRNSDYDGEAGLGEAVLEDALLTEVLTGDIPEVTDVFPGVGPTTGGIQVTIAGGNFQVGAEVYFGLETAEVVSTTPTTIAVILPAHSAGNCLVTVANPDGCTGVSAVPIFEYRQQVTQPQIQTVQPNTGGLEGGTFVTIRGTDFRTGAQVYFGSSAATSVSVVLEDPQHSLYKLICSTPAGTLGQADVVVINPSASFGVAVLEDGFEYRQTDSAPVVTSLTPSYGPVQGGTTVLIQGQDFRTGLEAFFDGIPAQSVAVVDEQTAVAVSPAHAAGKVPVTVLNYDGASFTFGDEVAEDGFTYVVPASHPQISSVNPKTGPAWEGTWVTITGLDFRVNPEVYFGTAAAESVEYEDYQTIRALTPVSQPGTVDVIVVNADYGTATLENGFTFSGSEPQVDAVNPSIGDRSGGALVSIIGSGFLVHEEAGVLTLKPDVYFEKGASQAETEVLSGSSSNELIVATPAAPGEVIGFYDIRVVNPDGSEGVLTDGFKYTVADSEPFITSLDPVQGSTAGGTPIKIYGADFRDGAQVFIGGKEAISVVVEDSATIKAVTPPHEQGAKNVTVVNYDGGSATITDGFTYVVPLSEPEITSVTPKSGPYIGGTGITISGKDFRDSLQVFIGGELCTEISVVSYKTVTAETPPGAIGGADVTLVNADCGSFTLENGFSYLDVKLPEIYSVAPQQGPAAGGTEIVVTGSAFQSGASLFVGGNAAQVVKVESSALTATTPAGDGGWQEVEVTNSDGGSAVLEEGFYYIPPVTPPDTPGWLDARAEDEGAVKLSWDEVDSAAYFEIYVREGGSGDYRFVDQTGSNTSEYFITGLRPHTTYYFRVRAINSAGLSLFSETDSARTGSSIIYHDEDEENVRVTVNQQSAVFGIPNLDALDDADCFFDFTEPDLRDKYLKVVQIPADIADDIRDTVLLRLQDAEITVPAAVWEPDAVDHLSKTERKQALVRLVVEDLGQRGAESISSCFPTGAKIISHVYAIYVEVDNRGLIQHPDIFESGVRVSFVPSSLGALGWGCRVYYRDSSGRWTSTTGSNWNWARIDATINRPAIFALVQGS